MTTCLWLKGEAPQPVKVASNIARKGVPEHRIKVPGYDCTSAVNGRMAPCSSDVSILPIIAYRVPSIQHQSSRDESVPAQAVRVDDDRSHTTSVKAPALSAE